MFLGCSMPPQTNKHNLYSNSFSNLYFSPSILFQLFLSLFFYLIPKFLFRSLKKNPIKFPDKFSSSVSQKSKFFYLSSKKFFPLNFPSILVTFIFFTYAALYPSKLYPSKLYPSKLNSNAECYFL